jgi:hypothetical protein
MPELLDPHPEQVPANDQRMPQGFVPQVDEARACRGHKLPVQEVRHAR